MPLNSKTILMILLVRTKDGILLASAVLRKLDLTSGEAIEFAKLNARVVQPSKTGMNPYYLGIKTFEDIEECFNIPDEEMKRRGVKHVKYLEKVLPYTNQL